MEDSKCYQSKDRVQLVFWRVFLKKGGKELGKHQIVTSDITSLQQRGTTQFPYLLIESTVKLEGPQGA